MWFITFIYTLNGMVVTKGKWRCKMKDTEIKQTDKEEYISKIYDATEQEKEQKFVNLMIEIIVSLTLKELYEEGN
jgi:7,8-dihydro-6-hydroxymethylpterin-pyrophosphokinase